METNFNFKSQVCTSIEQSRKLLELGLKKKTADMYYSTILENDDIARICYEDFWNSSKAIDGYIRRRCIPAWSLHRLIEIVAQTQYPYYVISKRLPIYDALCERIEWLIEEGYFPKEYLEE